MNTLDGFMIQEGQNKNGQLYEGVIEKSSLNNDVQLFRFRFRSKEEFTFDFLDETNTGLFLFINMNDKKSLFLTKNESSFKISAFASALVSCAQKINISCTFQSECNYNFIIIKSDISSLKLGKLDSFESLRETWSHDAFGFLKTGIPNLRICETAKKLLALNCEKWDEKLIAIGYYNIMLGLILKEESVKNNDYLKSNSFRCNEIKQLEMLTNDIKNNPERQFSLKDICRQTGLSVTKLQSGFKEMHNSTVAIYIREIRLAKAIEMLQQTDLNVSEIVYSVGLNSRSYFCRIFKQRFKCSPKSYQQKIRRTMSTAS